MVSYLVPILGTYYTCPVRVIAKRTLREFWKRYPDAKQPLTAWHFEALKADWQKPSDIKTLYSNASILKGNRVVFNIHGNTYILIVKINYDYKIVYILFVGTHESYDKIDASTV